MLRFSLLHLDKVRSLPCHLNFCATQQLCKCVTGKSSERCVCASASQGATAHRQYAATCCPRRLCDAFCCALVQVVSLQGMQHHGWLQGSDCCLSFKVVSGQALPPPHGEFSKLSLHPKSSFPQQTLTECFAAGTNHLLFPCQGSVSPLSF